jgi:hypothetical protein
MFKIIKKAVLSVALASLATTASADPGFGAGITYVFGDGVALGVKVFSTDDEKKGAASAGMDYLFGSKAWRPNAGIAYLGVDYYVDITVGYNLKSKAVDYGIGGGYANTDDDDNDKVIIVPPPPPPNGTEPE